MAVHQLACAHCGAQFAYNGRQLYCSYKCRIAARANRLRIQAGKPKRWADGIPKCHKDHVCLNCKVVFKPKRAGRAKFCGRKCAFDWKRLVARLSKPVCFRTFRAKPKQAPAPKPKLCRACGVVTEKSKQYCNECRNAARLARKQADILSGARAAHRKARKAKRRTATVEAVNPLRVLERDGWRCQLCGVATPKRLRGTYDDRAPEVDHIIPLSQGGEHSYRNTQCACRKCNALKGSKPLGQLRLVA